MRKKSIWLVISTLLLLLIISLISCRSSSNTTKAYAASNANPSRFSSENVSISGNYHYDEASIITDHQTGKQYLYITTSVNHGAAMVELDSVGETLSNIDE